MTTLVLILLGSSRYIRTFSQLSFSVGLNAKCLDLNFRVNCSFDVPYENLVGYKYQQSAALKLSVTPLICVCLKLAKIL